MVCGGGLALIRGMRMRVPFLPLPFSLLSNPARVPSLTSLITLREGTDSDFLRSLMGLSQSLRVSLALLELHVLS